MKKRMCVMLDRLGAILRRRWRDAAYYCGVLMVLCAVAYAAEVYRSDGEVGVAVLPAVELTLPEENKEDVEEKPALTMPAAAQVLREYCADLVWNDSLGQWENHEGIDIAFENRFVRALCDGVVSGIGCVPELGNYVEITSGDLTLRYGSTMASAALSEGDEISAGDSVGEADDSMPGEGHMPYHAHIEVMLSGVKHDPAVYF